MDENEVNATSHGHTSKANTRNTWLVAVKDQGASVKLPVKEKDLRQEKLTAVENKNR